MVSGEGINLEELKKELNEFLKLLKAYEKAAEKKARKQINEKVKEIAYNVLLKVSEDKDLARLFVASIAYYCFKHTSLAKKMLKILKETLEVVTETDEVEDEIYLDLAAELSVPK